MGIVPSNMKSGSLRGRTARMAAREGDTEKPDGGTPEGFNPAEHNVDDVVAYARTHPDEAAAILKAEKSAKGKKRKTVIDALSG